MHDGAVKNSMGEGLAYLEQCSLTQLKELERQSRRRSLQLRVQQTHSSDGHASAERYKHHLLLEKIAKKACERYCAHPIEHDRWNLQSNDTLALGRSGVLQIVASELAGLYPVGSGSSRLLAGHYPIFEELEKMWADICGLPASLYVNSGYVANEILPQVLAFPEVSFFSDSANHASLIDGIRLAKVRKELRHVFPHLNYRILEQQLQNSSSPCNIIFCESLYSMDGDFSDLLTLQRLARLYRGVLVVDEAHATGVYGAQGLGVAAEVLKGADNVIIVHTFGKAIATQGAMISGPLWLREWIINKGRAFIYTTAASPLLAACTYVALKSVSSVVFDQTRTHVSYLSALMRQLLRAKGYALGESSSHIIPVLVGNDAEALSLGRYLQNKGVLTGIIRPPTVPEGQSRLRLSLHAGLQMMHIESLISAFPKQPVE